MWFFNPLWIVQVVLYGLAAVGGSPFNYAPIDRPAGLVPSIHAVSAQR